MVKKAIGAGILAGLILFVIFQQFTKENEAEQKAGASNNSGLTEGVLAPSFTLTTLNGAQVKLEDYRGKKVLLNFWATWCPPCKAEMPAMEKLYNKYSGEFEILSVNLDPENDVEGFVKEKNLSFKILLDKKQEVQTQYSIISIPTTYMVDEKGVIINKHIGSMTYGQLKEFLK